ncbi:hypothetical protein HT031_004497 [Scenedesmus sp. PABB004]|nr:hypothetical protein HT031_004497 [Scenedesmus sp. PABB004]
MARRRGLLAAGAALALLALAAGRAAAQGGLVCDGTLRQLDMAAAPFPSMPPWTPWVGPRDFTCERTAPGTTQKCASMAADVCGDIPFEPVVQASGPTPGIIPPNNPLSFKLRPDSPAYLTYVEFRAGDVGTGGALVRGVYGRGAGLPDVTTTYAWAKNGPTTLEGGGVVFDVCSDCRVGYGVKNLDVTARPGTGFRAFELSQLYADTRCEGSGVNNDGMLWSGMRYRCVEPTCGDTDLNTEGPQQFDGCEAPLFYNPDAADEKNPSKETCCYRGIAPVTCGAVRPGEQFSCPFGWEFDATATGVAPPSVDACCVVRGCRERRRQLPATASRCGQTPALPLTHSPPAAAAAAAAAAQKATCSNTSPATAPGQDFVCPAGYEYDSGEGRVSPPSIGACCKAATCEDVQPVTAPGKRFDCGDGSVYNAANGGTSPPTQDACCLVRAAPRRGAARRSAAGAGGRAHAAPAGRLLTRPLPPRPLPPRARRRVHARQRKTCGSPDPRDPFSGFDCRAGSEFDPAAINTSPPSQAACCKDGTCARPFPVTKPDLKYDCPASSQYDPSMGSTSPPSDRTCCKPATCSNMEPVTRPGQVSFTCPRGYVADPRAVNAAPANKANCCFAFTPTCGSVDPFTPGTHFDCASSFKKYNASAADRPPSVANCCVRGGRPPARTRAHFGRRRRPPARARACPRARPHPARLPGAAAVRAQQDFDAEFQSDVDLYVTKVVSPAANAERKLSKVQGVGEEFEFTLTVGMNAVQPNARAANVVLSDRLPRGLTLKRLAEKPADNACAYTTDRVTCTWKRFSASDVKTITLTVTGMVAGEHRNNVSITTDSTDTDGSNNDDHATARVAGACCPADGGACVHRQPEDCAGPGAAFSARRNCDELVCEAQARQPGACCVTEFNVAVCTDNVDRADCQGRWSEGRACSQVGCVGPTGACCMVPNGGCRNNVTRAQCPNAGTWKLGGRCGADSYCVGGCCNAATGGCSTGTRETCTGGGRWTLYGQCDLLTCPAPVPVCKPAWWQCTPPAPGQANPCCAGYTCQATYDKCVVGPHVCKPAQPECVPDGGSCGGRDGCCCKGLTCDWDHRRKRGSCRPIAPSCLGEGWGPCTADSQCCRGNRCKDGVCARAECHRECRSYECFKDRERDCACFFAAAASL